MHSAGMHMRQMQILLSGGKSAADMALGLVDIENVTRFCGKLRVNAKQPVSIRDVLVHSGFADAKLLCSLTHRGIVFNYVVGDFHRPCLNKRIKKILLHILLLQFMRESMPEFTQVVILFTFFVIK